MATTDSGAPEKMDVMPPELLVGMVRNEWSASIGFAGRHGPDYALDRLKQFLGLKHYGLWQWEELNRAYTSIQFEDPQNLPHLGQIVPDSQEPVWFLFHVWTLSGPPVYEGTTAEIEKITKERSNLRCYIIAKDFSWLVAKDHRNEVVAIGEEVEHNLNQLRNENAG